MERTVLLGHIHGRARVSVTMSGEDSAFHDGNPNSASDAHHGGFVAANAEAES